MIVIVEGIDRVGKTTLVEMLKSVGFMSFKDEFNIFHGTEADFRQYSVGKLDTTLTLLKKLHDEGKNVVIDRFHLTEYVYGNIERDHSAVMTLVEVDKFLLKLNALLVYVAPVDLELSCEKAGKDLRKHNDLFEFIVGTVSTGLIKCNYGCLEMAFDYIVSNTFDYDIYFASPFFREDQIEREERMIKHLRSLGFKVFSPKENCNLQDGASQGERQKVFDENCKAIRSARMVFAVTDTKDIGTIWEAGYAYAENRPIAYFAETLGSGQFNLMLAQSGHAVFTQQSDVTETAISHILRGGSYTYDGRIE